MRVTLATDKTTPRVVGILTNYTSPDISHDLAVSARGTIHHLEIQLPANTPTPTQDIVIDYDARTLNPDDLITVIRSIPELVAHVAVPNKNRALSTVPQSTHFVYDSPPADQQLYKYVLTPPPTPFVPRDSDWETFSERAADTETTVMIRPRDTYTFFPSNRRQA